MSADFLPDRHAPSPEERATEREEVSIARDLISSLPPRRRAVMLLRYGWGLSPAQICGRIGGLSARAYRREVSRGVEQLAQRMRSFERGEWCHERAELLHAYVAGVASEDESLQVRHHLGHCRSCARHVGKMRTSLGTLGVAVPAPVGLGLLFGNPQAGWLSKLAEVPEELVAAAVSAWHSAQEFASRIRFGGDAAGKVAELSGQAASGSSAAAAGGGLAGAMAGAGATKLVAACIVGAGACAAIGIGAGDVVGGGEPVRQVSGPAMVESIVRTSQLPPLPAESSRVAGGAAKGDGDAARGTGPRRAETPTREPARAPVTERSRASEFDAVNQAAVPAPPVAPPVAPDEAAREFGLP